MLEGYKIWENAGLPPLADDEKILTDDNFEAACHCFYLFRKLHEMVNEEPEKATLVGDYFFSEFSKNLIPLDSVWLNDEFAKFLARDTLKPASKEEYLAFVEGLKNG